MSHLELVPSRLLLTLVAVVATFQRGMEYVSCSRMRRPSLAACFAPNIPHTTLRRIGKKFFLPVTIQRWVVVVYEGRSRFTSRDAEDMVRSFISQFEEVGMYSRSGTAGMPLILLDTDMK